MASIKSFNYLPADPFLYTLKKGGAAPAALVYLTLGRLLYMKRTSRSCLIDLFNKCKNPHHCLSASSLSILRCYRLLTQDEKNVFADVRLIILSAINETSYNVIEPVRGKFLLKAFAVNWLLQS